jgi:hypothetical protein
VKHLQAIVRKRASEQGVSFDVAEEAFWSEVSRAAHTQIMDQAFNMPEKKGILVSQ